MVSIDIDLLKKFDMLEGNRSDFFERAMVKRIKGIEKKDMPEEALSLKCSKCGLVVEYGFFCESTRKFFCSNCNLEEYRLADGTKCSRFSCYCRGEHEHIRVPGFDNSRLELMELIKKEQNENK